MTELKVGDKVRVHDRGYSSSEWVGTEGIVVETETTSGLLTRLRLTKENGAGHKAGYVANISKENLELIPEFTFKDIQKGDLIRRTFERGDGSKVIWEGTADRLNYNGQTWMTEGNCALAYKADADHTDITLELIERPKPKEIWEEAEAGDMIFRKDPHDNHRLTTVFVKREDGDWDSIYTEATPGKGAVRTTERLALLLKDYENTLVKK